MIGLESKHGSSPLPVRSRELDKESGHVKQLDTDAVGTGRKIAEVDLVEI